MQAQVKTNFQNQTLKAILKPMRYKFGTTELTEQMKKKKKQKTSQMWIDLQDKGDAYWDDTNKIWKLSLKRAKPKIYEENQFQDVDLNTIKNNINDALDKVGNVLANAGFSRSGTTIGDKQNPTFLRALLDNKGYTSTIKMKPTKFKIGNRGDQMTKYAILFGKNINEALSAYYSFKSAQARTDDQYKKRVKATVDQTIGEKNLKSIKGFRKTMAKISKILDRGSNPNYFQDNMWQTGITALSQRDMGSWKNVLPQILSLLNIQSQSVRDADIRTYWALVSSLGGGPKRTFDDFIQKKGKAYNEQQINTIIEQVAPKINQTAAYKKRTAPAIRTLRKIAGRLSGMQILRRLALQQNPQNIQKIFDELQQQTKLYQQNQMRE